MKRFKTNDRKKQIINEAINIIHNSGYESLTIKRLSGKVGISEAALYRHFESKEKIILGVLDRMKEFDKQLINHTEEFKDKSKKIYELINFHFRYFNNNPEITSVIFSEDIFRNGKSIGNKFLNIISERRKIICQTLEDAKKSHEFKGINTCQLANIILGFIRFIVLEWRLSGYKYPILEKGKYETKTLMKLINNIK